MSNVGRTKGKGHKFSNPFQNAKYDNHFAKAERNKRRKLERLFRRFPAYAKAMGYKYAEAVGRWVFDEAIKGMAAEAKAARRDDAKRVQALKERLAALDIQAV
jgi:hypothetical protein